MSKKRYWWYDYVKKATIKSMSSNTPATMQESYFYFAVKKALAATEKKPRSEERLELIDIVYKQQKRNIPGAAMQMNISESTASNWAREFIYTVADYAGFL